MKETSFIKQNKKKWARFEKLSGKGNNDPDEVAELFTEITEDLSYARTFYPRRSVKVYLNQLSQGVFTSLYKQRKQPIRIQSFFSFWTETVPLEMYRSRVNLLTAFLFFLLAAVIGAVSTYYDMSFAEIVTSESYIADTERRISEGNPMGVYGESAEGSMFWMITVNNIRVALITFAMGIVFSVGSLFMLLRNGVMLGGFQWWFYLKGLGLTSFLAIWIHGAFEISAIVIAGAAGLTVGNGLLFPKSYTRIQSLVFSAKRGLVIMLSLIPFFIIAGFLESYVTRHYKVLPDLVKWTIILGSFAIIILYYVVYPFIVARRYPERVALKQVPRYIPKRKINLFKIRKVGEIFTDTFYVFISKAGKLSQLFFVLIFPLIIGLGVVIYAQDWSRFDWDLAWYENLGTLFGTDIDFRWYKFGCWSAILGMLISAVYYVFGLADDDEQLFKGYFRFLLKHYIWLLLYSTILLSVFLFLPGALMILLIFISPVFTMIPSIIVIEKKDFFSAFVRSFTMGKGSYADALGSFIVFIMITVIFFFVLANPMFDGEIGLLKLLDDVIKDFTITLTPNYQVIIMAVNSVVYVLFIFLMLSVYFLSFSFNYYSSQERLTARGLYDRLAHFGKRNRSFETDVDFES